MLVTQSHPTLCDPMDCSQLSSSVCGILQARIMEWIAIAFSGGSSQLRDRTWVSCIAGRRFTIWATLLLLSHFSRVRLCATPETAAHQAPQSLGFSRQEHWSGLPFPTPIHKSEKWVKSSVNSSAPPLSSQFPLLDFRLCEMSTLGDAKGTLYYSVIFL